MRRVLESQRVRHENMFSICGFVFQEFQSIPEQEGMW